MPETKKQLTAVEACRKIGKEMRAKLTDLKKSEFTPVEAALKVLPEVIAQIKAHEEHLVKMRNLEKSEDKCASCGSQATKWHGSVRSCQSCATHTPEKLKIKDDTKKSEPALANVTPDSNKEIDHKFKLSKVFEVLGKASIMEVNRKQLASKPTDKVENAFRHKDSVLPTDAPPKVVSSPDGKIEKGKKLGKEEEDPSLEKGWRLGGKDPASKAATSHAMHAGSVAMNNKINKMPARQLPKPKMPTPQVHAARQSELASFTPKGHFDKNEEMEKAFDAKGRFITPDKLQPKRKLPTPGKK